MRRHGFFPCFRRPLVDYRAVATRCGNATERWQARARDRAALTGILFVLRTGIEWEMLPLEMGFGSGITCWRRLRDWQEAGLWDELHRELPRRLRTVERVDWSRACIDSASLAAKGDDKKGPDPTEAGSARNAI